MLANFFNLGFSEVWVALPNDFGDEDLVGRLSVDAPCSSPCKGVVLKDVSLEIVEVGLDDLLDSCSGRFFESLDSQCPRFGGIVIAVLGLESEVGSEDLLPP